MLRNNVGGGLQTAVNLTKTQAGSFIKTLDVETQYLPGNFGVRILE